MGSIRSRVRRNVIAVDESISCAEAARVMAEHGVASVGVRRGDRLVGIVSGRELLRAIVGGSPRATPVAEALRACAPAVPAGASDRDCAQLMRRCRTAHLPVEDGGEVVGMISLLDLMLEDNGTGPRRSASGDDARHLAFDPMGLVPAGIRPGDGSERERGSSPDHLAA